MIRSISLVFLGFITLFGLVNAQGKNQCEAFIDLTLIIDSSGSISVTDFEEAKKALLDLVSRLNVGTEKAGVAIINYASTLELADAKTDVFEFERIEILNQIAGLQRLGTNTSTGEALALAKSYCDARCRPTARAVPRVFAIFTDGHSNEGRPAIPAAEQIRAKPTEGSVFAVGVGNIGTAGDAELLGIAGDPNYVMKVGSYLDLARVINAITIKMCEFPAFVVPDTLIAGEASANSTRYYRMHTLKKVNKNAFFEIEVSDRVGKAAVYASTTNKKPATQSSRTVTSRANGNTRTYTTYVPANAENFYFSVKGVGAQLNKFDFTVHVRPVGF